MQLDWNLLGRAPDFGDIVRKGMAQGRDTVRQSASDNALAALAQNADDPRAMQQLAAIDPGAAWKFQDRATDAKNAQAKLLEAQQQEYGDSIKAAGEILQRVTSENPGIPKEQAYDITRRTALQMRIKGAEMVPEQFDEQYYTAFKYAADGPKAANKPTSVEEYEYAARQGYTGSYMDFQQTQGSPVAVKNEDGTTTFYPRTMVNGQAPQGGNIPPPPPGFKLDQPSGGQPQPAAGGFLDPLAPR